MFSPIVYDLYIYIKSWSTHYWSDLSFLQSPHPAWILQTFPSERQTLGSMPFQDARGHISNSLKNYWLPFQKQLWGSLSVSGLLKPAWVTRLPLADAIILSGGAPLTWRRRKKCPLISLRERRESCRFPPQEIPSPNLPLNVWSSLTWAVGMMVAE